MSVVALPCGCHAAIEGAELHVYPCPFGRGQHYDEIMAAARELFGELGIPVDEVDP